MSGSENDVGSLGMQNSSPVPLSQPMIQNMQLAFVADGNAVYKPVAGNSNGNGNGDGIGTNIGMGIREPAKKKRGRPRKYGPEASIPVPLSSAHPTTAQANISQPPSGTFSSLPTLQQQQRQLPPQSQQQQHHQHHQQPPPQSPSQDGRSQKKARGRPPGAGRKNQLDDHGAPGIGFTPHVITVNTGEDVTARIMSFSQAGPRAICILSANGAISNVTLRQAATSGGSVTYEGRFEILSLSGSFTLSDGGGPRSRAGGLSVSLAGPDGRVLGGGVAGVLIAASPVQVVVGSFIADGQREVKVGNHTEHLFSPAKPHAASGPTGPGSPQSHGTLSESSGGDGSPLNQSTGAVNSTPLGMSVLPWK
ncbi:hypothetical protein SOVF_091570 [Spinacia oleracea]|uniref:AT-hook motif nuclear-localized protein n=1 Tax=Spinacia oleracea TaxID=3562 RepID=A0A9R0IL92_SPIOL|nr:AT-hook motif nuclear-localized protein 10 [Spinacia oleracea]XP_021850204.1 AT-hook motif nuclear-localized protein 10 [Spinacia oleracea]KNA16163.1 hypothetical protein SOVF_091570 [Spinacia oleracea]